MPPDSVSKAIRIGANRRSCAAIQPFDLRWAVLAATLVSTCFAQARGKYQPTVYGIPPDQGGNKSSKHVRSNGVRSDILFSLRIIAVAVFLLPGLCAQQLPDGEALIKQTGVSTARFQSLQYVGQVTMEIPTPSGPIKIVSESSVVYVNPGKFRVESKPLGITFVAESGSRPIRLEASFLTISDGATTTGYNSMRNEYVRIPVGMGSEGLQGPVAVMNKMGLPMPDMSKAHMTSKTLRDEVIEIDGVKHDCWVVESQLGNMDVPVPKNPKMQIKISDVRTTFWIDKKLAINLQMEMNLNMDGAANRLKIAMKDLKIDQPVPDSLFVFAPPADAKEVKEMSLLSGVLPKPELEGKDAPAFEVKGLDAKPYSLAALRGKPVLLDFWATWCEPCRVSMPIIERLYGEYKDQDLVVLAIDAGEERSAVEEFVKRNPMAYPAVLSGESGIVESYKISAYPTFVLIGRDGKVAAEEIGFPGEESLRAMLSKAGLKAPIR